MILANHLCPDEVLLPTEQAAIAVNIARSELAAKSIYDAFLMPDGDLILVRDGAMVGVVGEQMRTLFTEQA